MPHNDEGHIADELYGQVRTGQVFIRLAVSWPFLG